MLSREENDLIKLGKICQKVVDTRTFGSSPAVMSLNGALFSHGWMKLCEFDVRPKWMLRVSRLKIPGACMASDEVPGAEGGEVRSILVL